MKAWLFGATLGPVLVLLAASDSSGQQVADTAFQVPIPHPAFAEGQGPVVCVDSGHRNAHRLDGRYAPLGRLLESDGFRVRDHPTLFTSESLGACDLLVIANAGDVDGPPPPAYPHSSAFSEDEHSALLAWVLGGGRLWLLTDHPPYAGAISPLASIMGFQVFDGYVGPGPTSPTGSAVFGILDEDALRRTTDAFDIPYESFRAGLGQPGRLSDHVILNGRSPDEAIDRVMSFTGTAFFPSSKVEPLLTFGPQATGVVILAGNVSDAPASDYPTFPMEGWLLAGSRHLGDGRVILLTEAAMCSAQIVGRQRIPAGFNMPFASRNAQFCLNVAHWLAGILA